MVQSMNIDNPELILATSGESFHWARRFLGAKMGHDAARLYSFCRVLDDMADGDIQNGPEHLVEIQAKLIQGQWGNHPLLDQFSDMVDEYGLSTNVVSSLVEGLLDDQADEVLIKDEANLIQYAYKVAGTVGLLMCDVLNTDEPRAKPHAIDLGIGMQLTNIARDVLEDAKMGRRYLPGTWVDNMTPQQILEASKNPIRMKHSLSQKRFIDYFHLQRSTTQVDVEDWPIFPTRAHFSIGVAAKVYRQIGIQLLKSKDSWHGQRQVTSKASKVFCTLRATMSLFRRFPHPRKPHNTTLHTSLAPYKNQGGTWG